MRASTARDLGGKSDLATSFAYGLPPSSARADSRLGAGPRADPRRCRARPVRSLVGRGPHPADVATTRVFADDGARVPHDRADPDPCVGRTQPSFCAKRLATPRREEPRGGAQGGAEGSAADTARRAAQTPVLPTASHHRHPRREGRHLRPRVHRPRGRLAKGLLLPGARAGPECLALGPSVPQNRRPPRSHAQLDRTQHWGRPPSRCNPACSRVRSLRRSTG